MNSVDRKLKERVKELKCLYELSKVAWEAKHDVDAIVARTLQILPDAMQFAAQAEAYINLGDDNYTTSNFSKCEYFIESGLRVDNRNYGKVVIGYRKPNSKKKEKFAFLPEEKNLLKAVARELSLFIKRASVEDEKQKLEMQLQHVERLAFVGELSAGIAHELNEPLGRILGFAQLIKKTGNLGEQQSEDIERIIKASLYTREIIKKLMIFSRQMPQQITKVNLNDIVESILYFIDVRFQSRGITIVKQLDQALPSINADEVQMSQVLVNLITNAVHAMPEGGQITVATKRKADHVMLIVKDNGTGMSTEVKEKIFEPFFTTKPVGQGTGLGLSVVQGIIDSHHGRINVTSAPGRGSKFEIQLPNKKSRQSK
jgi:two-component system, NtrC family, sensor kinase